MISRGLLLMLWGLLWNLMVLCGDPLVADEQVGVVQLEIFLRSDKPSGEDVKKYAAELTKRVQGLEVLIRDVLEPQQLQRLYDLSKRVGRDKPVVPAFHSCGRIHFGYSGAGSASAIEALFTADVYTRQSCPRCTEAKRFIKELKARWPAIEFRILDVANDAAALQKWQVLCRGAGAVPGLPTIDFAGSVIIGYQGDAITGKQLEALIERKSKVEEAARPQAQPALNTNSYRGRIHERSIRFVIADSSLDHAGLSTAGFSTIAFVQPPPALALPEEASDADDNSMPTTQAPASQLAAPPSTESDTIEVPVLGKLRVSELGLTVFSFSVGLVDGFNPCAMWVLVFLLSVLVNIKDRRKIILIAGTFVLVSGLAYFAFMAAWLNLFLLIGIARPVQILLGSLAILIGTINVKDFFAFKRGITLSIPDSQKPGLYRRVRSLVEAKYLAVAVSGAVGLAIFVNLIELLCTAGLPALFTQVLTLQNLTTWQYYFYLAVYIAAYMLDDSVLLMIVIVTLSHRKLQEREGRWLKLISGVAILVLGGLMIFKPEWLQIGH